MQNESNDLISREALKKALANNTLIRDFNFQFDGIIGEIIDNAPTVEPFEPDYVGAERLEARQRGYEQGYHFGMMIGKTLNPKIKKGYWNEIKAGMLVCPFCGARPHKDFKNFCAKCGADMRGDEE